LPRDAPAGKQHNAHESALCTTDGIHCTGKSCRFFADKNNFSVSSGVGFLALVGVCVETGVIMLEYINQLRARGRSVVDAAVEGAVLRLRTIMMTTLVATLGLLAAAMSRAIGSDSQRPFAIVIVGGLLGRPGTCVFTMQIVGPNTTC
jgi:Cu/Ag efflux pump CusA